MVGIDLGTTNSAVAYVDLQADAVDKDHIRIFHVPQLTGPGEFARLPVLPSFLYLPGQYDLPADAIAVPWQTEPGPFAGAFARDHGARVPTRLVSSAKSWLCHARVDRRGPILPWGSGDEVRKVSPVQATAAYLSHIRNAWNRAQGDDEDAFLEHQWVNVTVPASFDEVARDLTVEAAALAGLPRITLLEEPLAAFYSWLIEHENRWDQFVQPGQLILVCDVGGGTTDFTLITLREVDGRPRFERIAVGDHLILGGDNIDLALARALEPRLGQQAGKLSVERWKALCHQCRQAKEAILDGQTERHRVTLVGQGRQLIGGALSAQVDRELIDRVVLDGFFPLARSQPSAAATPRQGISEFGLPYEPQPAITRHLGQFLERHRPAVCEFLQRDSHAPDLVLFNGGSLKSSVVQQRICKAVQHWFQLDAAAGPGILENPAPDLAVALGAAYYGLVKTGRGVKVGSGSARAYFLGVAAAPDAADASTGKAVCVVERGLEEGSAIALDGLDFQVLTNQPVHFSIYSSSFRSGDRCGDVIAIDDTLTLLPPLQTVIQFGKRGSHGAIPCRIEAGYTELGVLALWCRSQSSAHRWQLQFQLRHTGELESAEVADSEIFDEDQIQTVSALIENAFAADADPKNLDSLIKQIGAALARPKDKWPLSLIRRLADDLLAQAGRRKLSPAHEMRWLNLVGFCMRPGFGHAMDTVRVKQLWRIYGQGMHFAQHPQVRLEWWVLWRRIAGGLKAGQQRQFSQDLTGVLTAKKGPGGRHALQERIEIWMALANMERLLVKDKLRWGNLLLDEMTAKKSRAQHFWAISRLGARQLLYGPADRAIGPRQAMQWAERLMHGNWRQVKSVGAALAQLARQTGDRARDLDPDDRRRLLEWMEPQDALQPYMRCIAELVSIESREQSVIFGESLPAGLILQE